MQVKTARLRPAGLVKRSLGEMPQERMMGLWIRGLWIVDLNICGFV